MEVQTSAKKLACYGIYQNGTLLYIGSTTNYPARVANHRHQIKKKMKRLFYAHITQPDQIEFRVLERTKDVTRRRVLEQDFIELLKPIYNQRRAFWFDPQKRQLFVENYQNEELLRKMKQQYYNAMKRGYMKLRRELSRSDDWDFYCHFRKYFQV